MREAPRFSAWPRSPCLDTLLAGEHGDSMSSPTATNSPPHPELPAQIQTTSQELPSPYHSQLASQIQGD